MGPAAMCTYSPLKRYGLVSRIRYNGLGSRFSLKHCWKSGSSSCWGCMGIICVGLLRLRHGMDLLLSGNTNALGSHTLVEILSILRN